MESVSSIYVSLFGLTRRCSGRISASRDETVAVGESCQFLLSLRFFLIADEDMHIGLDVAQQLLCAFHHRPCREVRIARNFGNDVGFTLIAVAVCLQLIEQSRALEHAEHGACAADDQEVPLLSPRDGEQLR